MAKTTQKSGGNRNGIFMAFGGVAFGLCLTGLALAHFHAPVEGTLGIVQKIFYFHVPAAISTYVGFMACAAGSLIYLLKPVRWADHMGRAGAEVGVLMALVVLTSGPLWAYKSWGTFWEWEPRLTSMLLTVMIYVSYLLLRQFGGTGEAARRIGAVMGVPGPGGSGDRARLGASLGWCAPAGGDRAGAGDPPLDGACVLHVHGWISLPRGVADLDAHANRGAGRCPRGAAPECR